MGGSSSTDQKNSGEQHELESLAASTGALPLLQKAFSKLSDPQTNSIPLKSLQEGFCMSFETKSSETHVPECFPKLLSNLGLAIIDLFFVPDKNGVNWIEFLRGYTKCCGRMSSSMALMTLYRIYAATSAKIGVPTKLEFDSEDPDCKISGYFTSNDVVMLLWVCWVKSQSSKFGSFTKREMKLDLPDIKHLVLSAITSSTDVDLNVWECSISSLEVQLPAQKFHMWAVATVPSLANCLTQYVNYLLQHCAASEESEDSSSSVVDVTSTDSHGTHLLTCGVAWSISLTLTSTLSEELLRASLPRSDGEYENLLYRSSLHGKGLNRFWLHVDGYLGPLLILVSASTNNSSEGDSSAGRWVIGALTQQGVENKDTFYGSSGSLYAISPIFHVFPSYGNEKNFVYSHLHPAGRVYNPHPKPVGLAFGGTSGNERIFIDEDFSKMTVRHHAVDKTYRHGSLFPNQGFLPVEASVFQVEVWGLAGQKAKEAQDAYRQREQLFTNQRRTIDLKTFGNWEDSPEKMMMNMVSDPNRPQREER